ncbi:MAG: DNA mismatch repair endonuclease MutL [Peptococcaceae bacterium]|nr:DNA mismatch repair endonuclease MutL [Peptococcaceae bacterium]
MTTIRILDDFTRNQIAAGEVVERPFSVVKELTENSLDAGADRISVELDQGGLAAITVIDNGCGMGEKNLELAFQRHATSKIRCGSDLHRVLTLGFRGEALPSIAAVSRMDFTTKTANVLNGIQIEVVEGVITNKVTTGCPQGSIVVVRDLFFNTPVRKKSMKTPSNEGSLCSEIVAHMALARPGVSFALKNNNRRSFYSPGTGNLIDAIIAVYGVNQAREMIPVDGAGNGVALDGFIGKPSLSRSNRQHINIIINGRYVYCPAAARAVEEAYRTLLPTGRKPVAVLNLIVPPELIDVNVHPAKLEVRLVEENKVIRQITSVLRETLLSPTVIPTRLFDRRNNRQQTLHSQWKAPAATAPKPIQKDNVVAGSTKPHLAVIYNKHGSEGRATEKVVAEAETAGYLNDHCFLPKLTVIGQIGLTYILAAGEGGLYILDQHAAHERVLYEYYQALEEDKPCQGLLQPVTLELDHREAAILTERVFWFNRAGFVLEYFGGSTFLLRGTPPGLTPGREKVFFQDMLKYLGERGASAAYDEFSRQIASSLACRNAVKAGDKLTQPAMEALVKRLSGVKNPYTCPHGRPTLIHLSFRDLEKRFRR